MEGGGGGDAGELDEQVSDSLGGLTLAAAQDSENDQAKEQTNTHKNSDRKLKGKFNNSRRAAIGEDAPGVSLGSIKRMEAFDRLARGMYGNVMRVVEGVGDLS